MSAVSLRAGITGQPFSARHRCVELRGHEVYLRRAWSRQATPMIVIVFGAPSPWSGLPGVFPVPLAARTRGTGTATHRSESSAAPGVA
jgi:hypothetical protein